jgi:hypothetical protein
MGLPGLRGRWGESICRVSCPRFPPGVGRWKATSVAGVLRARHHELRLGSVKLPHLLKGRTRGEGVAVDGARWTAEQRWCRSRLSWTSGEGEEVMGRDSGSGEKGVIRPTCGQSSDEVDMV